MVCISDSNVAGRAEEKKKANKRNDNGAKVCYRNSTLTLFCMNANECVSEYFISTSFVQIDNTNHMKAEEEDNQVELNSKNRFKGTKVRSTI